MNSQRINKHTPKNPASEWFKDCKTPEDKKKRYEELQGGSFLLDQLKQMIQQRYDSCVSTSETDYDCPSWSHKQAHRNGRLEAYEEIFKLLP